MFSFSAFCFQSFWRILVLITHFSIMTGILKIQRVFQYLHINFIVVISEIFGLSHITFHLPFFKFYFKSRFLPDFYSIVNLKNILLSLPLFWFKVINSVEHFYPTFFSLENIKDIQYLFPLPNLKRCNTFIIITK